MGGFGGYPNGFLVYRDHLLTCNCETTYPLGHICSHHWVDPRGNLQETGKPVFFNHEICSLFSSFGACFVELDIM